IFLKAKGPTQLAFADGELEKQGPEYHREGFSSPIGALRGSGKSAAELTDAELVKLGFSSENRGRMEFRSGIVLEGRLKGKTARNGKPLILSFEDCRVTRGPEVLFDPAWGTFDLACGASVV